MALSIHSLDGKDFDTSEKVGLWDSESESYIATGSPEQVEKIKHNIEKLEQSGSNREYFESVKKTCLTALKAGGKTQAQAEESLRKAMPNLYQL